MLLFACSELVHTGGASKHMVDVLEYNQCHQHHIM